MSAVPDPRTLPIGGRPLLRERGLPAVVFTVGIFVALWGGRQAHAQEIPEAVEVPSGQDAIREPSPVSWSWVRGPGADACPPEDELASRLRRALGRDPFGPGGRSIEAIVERTDTGYVARIYQRGPDGVSLGTRDFTSAAEECEPIASAVVLTVALAIDPRADLAALAPNPSGLPPATPPAPRAPNPAPPQLVPVFVPVPAPCSEARPCVAAPAVSQDRGFAGSFVVQGGAMAGVVPGLAGMAGLAGHIEIFARVHLGAGAVFVPESSTSGGDFAFGLTTGFLSACYDVIHTRRVSLAACGVGHLGSIHGVATTLEPVEPGDQAWGALGVAPRLAVRLVGPLVAEAGVEGLAPLVRYEFRVVGDDRTAYHQAPVAMRSFLGLGVTIP